MVLWCCFEKLAVVVVVLLQEVSCGVVVLLQEVSCSCCGVVSRS